MNQIKNCLTMCWRKLLIKTKSYLKLFEKSVHKYQNLNLYNFLHKDPPTPSKGRSPLSEVYRTPYVGIVVKFPQGLFKISPKFNKKFRHQERRLAKGLNKGLGQGLVNEHSKTDKLRSCAPGWIRTTNSYFIKIDLYL